MNVKDKCDVRNPRYDRLHVIERKPNSAMQCANPYCSKELVYLREGSLQLLELESDSDQSQQDDGAFAIKELRSKFFWLCGECSKTHRIKRWTRSGLVLVLRNQKTANNRAKFAEPTAAETAQPLPVSLSVPSLTPMGHPRDKFASLALRGVFLIQRLPDLTISWDSPAST
jgi:hypothetical protein